MPSASSCGGNGVSLYLVFQLFGESQWVVSTLKSVFIRFGNYIRIPLEFITLCNAPISPDAILSAKHNPIIFFLK